MYGINYVCIGGNLVRDPDFRNVGQGAHLAEFTVAVNSARLVDGEKKQSVEFVSVVAWGRSAEISRDYLRKGSPVLVEGRIKQDRWEDKEGNKQSKTKVHADRIQFLGRKP